MRSHFTKPLISEALFRLLKTKDLQDITVVELVKTAGVSKASFYRNYLDLSQVIDEYLDSVFGKVYEKCPIDPSDMKHSIRTILEGIYEKKEQLTLLNKRGLLDHVDRYIYKTTYREIVKLSVLNNKYQPYFFAGATGGFIAGWIEGDFEDPPAAMAEYFMKSLHGYMPLSDE